MTDDERYEYVRAYPASRLSRVLLRQLVGKADDDADNLTSADVPRLRTLAELLTLVAPYEELPQLRLQVKELSAMFDGMADYLEAIGAVTDEVMDEGEES